jgi:beta-phosphoglucomutase-like phosphatase (HAD superfamily)
VLIELENTAFKGREVVFDAVAKALEDKEIKLDQLLFVRFFLTRGMAAAIPEVLKATHKTRFSATKLVPEVESLIREGLRARQSSPAAGAQKLVSQGTATGLRVGFLSDGDLATALPLAKACGVTDPKALLTAATLHDRVTTCTDAWHRLAIHMGVSPLRCVAVTTSAEATRAAMAAGMRCVAIPDRFTGFQDFGGADFVGDALDNAAIAAVLALAAGLAR